MYIRLKYDKLTFFLLETIVVAANIDRNCHKKENIFPICIVQQFNIFGETVYRKEGNVCRLFTVVFVEINFGTMQQCNTIFGHR